ncbi:MAG: hypothetical protein WC545_00405 [Patescibacteria group bacterium]|jgi:hypothetical protein
MSKVLKELVVNEERNFKWRIGKMIASSFAGFIAGLVVASAFFLAVFDLIPKF